MNIYYNFVNIYYSNEIKLWNDYIEDTFLLLDSLEEDQEYIKKLKPKICLEIGFVIKILK